MPLGKRGRFDDGLPARHTSLPYPSHILLFLPSTDSSSSYSVWHSSVSLSIYLSAHLLIFPSTHPPIHPSSHTSILSYTLLLPISHPSIHPQYRILYSIHLCIRLTPTLPICPSTSPSAQPFSHLLICLQAYPNIVESLVTF